jgi:hypothetical protein
VWALVLTGLPACAGGGKSSEKRPQDPVYDPGTPPSSSSNRNRRDDDDDRRRRSGECRSLDQRIRQCIDDISSAETELEEIEEYLRCIDRVEDESDGCGDEIEDEIEERCDDKDDDEATFDCLIAQGLFFTCVARAEESDDDPDDVARRYTYCFDNLRELTIECASCD